MDNESADARKDLGSVDPQGPSTYGSRCGTENLFARQMAESTQLIMRLRGLQWDVKGMLKIKLGGHSEKTNKLLDSFLYEREQRYIMQNLLKRRLIGKY